MIKLAAHEDIPALVELGREMCAESPLWSRMRYSPESVADTLGKLINHEDGLACIAVQDGVVVGAVLAVVEAHWASPDRVASELALFITKSARGRSYAVRLVSALVEWGRARGARFLQAGTSTGVNVDLTARIYERAGFERSAIGLEYDYGSVR
jgi:GNAT superfamily N-acetyltransferase